jgi:hypothetical protein
MHFEDALPYPTLNDPGLAPILEVRIANTVDSRTFKTHQNVNLYNVMASIGKLARVDQLRL